MKGRQACPEVCNEAAAVHALITLAVTSPSTIAWMETHVCLRSSEELPVVFRDLTAAWAHGAVAALQVAEPHQAGHCHSLEPCSEEAQHLHHPRLEIAQTSKLHMSGPADKDDA